MRMKAGPSSINKPSGSTKQPRAAPKCSMGRMMPCQPKSAWSAASGQPHGSMSATKAPSKISEQAT
eukprot:11422036-Alexandrium_andersonii.AAC.1